MWDYSALPNSTGPFPALGTQSCTQPPSTHRAVRRRPALPAPTVAARVLALSVGAAEPGNLLRPVKGQRAASPRAAASPSLPSERRAGRDKSISRKSESAPAVRRGGSDGNARLSMSSSGSPSAPPTHQTAARFARGWGESRAVFPVWDGESCGKQAPPPGRFPPLLLALPHSLPVGNTLT